MKLPPRPSRFGWLAATLLLNTFAAAHAESAKPVRVNRECVGYYTVVLPGDFEYALTTGRLDPRFSNFSDGLGAWGTEIRLDLIGLRAQQVSISQAADSSDLTTLMELNNAERQREIADVSDRRSRLQPSQQVLNEVLTERLAELPLFQRLSMWDAISRQEKGGVEFHVLIAGHVLSTVLEPVGTPEQTLNAFLHHHKPRALGEIPAGNGVCVPYGLFHGEERPAGVALNIRLKDNPEIVIFFKARDAATQAPDDPHEFMNKAMLPGWTFFSIPRNASSVSRTAPSPDGYHRWSKRNWELCTRIAQ